MRSTLLAAILAPLALTSAIAPSVAATEPAPKTVAAGMFLDFDANPVRYMGKNCTLGAVGTDGEGRKVGITAGHCNPYSEDDDVSALPGAPRGVALVGDDHPVWDRNDVESGPIGWMRWVSEDYSETSTTDYMVIEFAPHVVLSSRVVDQSGRDVFRIDSVHRDESGAVALPRPGEWVETYGGASDAYGVSSSDPVAYPHGQGMVVESGNGVFRSWAAIQPGDSGGPVIMRGTNEWVGIATRTRTDAFPQWESTSAQSILADLNSRPITGNGFTITDSDN